MNQRTLGFFISKDSSINKTPSTISSDFLTFLKGYIDNQAYRDNLCEVVGELVGNSLDHSNGDCFLEVDIYNVVDKEKKKHQAINMTVINLSDILLSTRLKNKYYEKALKIKKL